MPRAKTRVASRRRRKRMIKRASGYFGKRGNSISTAKDTVMRAGKYAYRDRRRRKREFRSLWIMRINAAARKCGTTYGRLMDGLRKKGVLLDRKVLAYMAMHQPEAFQKVVEQVKA